MKEYRKIATVKAKLFEEGDEDGFIHTNGFYGMMEDAHYGINPRLSPFIRTLENQNHKGEFGKHYLCVGIKGEKWLVEKDIFESTYQELASTSSQTEISDEEIEKKSDKETSIEWLIKELKLEGYDYTIKVAKKMYDKEIDECSKKHSIQKINPSDFIDEMFKNAGGRD